jgi:hypothetical protein
MRKPSLTAALASKAPPAPPPSPEAPATPAKAKVVTSLHISPTDLERLKIIAARERTKVNDLVLQGVAHVLALHDAKP